MIGSAAAAAPGGIVLIIERLAPERIDDDGAAVAIIRADIQMMAANGGMERTIAGYGELAARAGLELTRVARSRSEFSVLECRPAGAPRS